MSWSHEGMVVLSVHSGLGFIPLFTYVSYCVFIDVTMATRNERKRAYSMCVRIGMGPGPSNCAFIAAILYYNCSRSNTFIPDILPKPSKGQTSGQNLWHHVIRWRAIVLITLVFISSNQQMTTINIATNSKVQVHLFYCIYNLSVIKVTRSTKVSWGTCMSFLSLALKACRTSSFLFFFRTAGF